MNSRSRSESTWPRISRASPIQPKITRITISEMNWALASASRSVEKFEMMIGARASIPSR